MAFSAYQGSFSAKTSTGTQAYTGVGFQPKAVIFWVVNATAAGYAADANLGFGVSDGTTDYGVSSWVDDAAATSDSGIRHDAKSLLLIKDGSATVAVAASVSSLDADGFTLNYSTADGTAYLVHYLALGGTTLTAAKVGTIAAKTSTGTQAYTGVGFQPEGLLLFGAQLETTVPNNAASGKFMLGAASGASNQGAVWFRDRDAQATTSTASVFRTDKIMTGTSVASTTFVVEASLSSFDADGFTLNYSTAGALAFNYFYLALDGASVYVGSDTQKTSTGTQAKTGVGFKPAALMLFGAQQTTTGVFNGAAVSVGASDGTNEGFAWMESQNGLADSEANTAYTTDKIIRFATGPSTTSAEADLSSMDSDGYTLNWTTADATARQFVALAVGPYTAPATSRIDHMTLLGVS